MAYFSTSAGSDLKNAANDRDRVFSLIGQLVSKLAEIDLALLTAVELVNRDDVIAQYAAEWKTDERFRLVDRLLVARKASKALLNNFQSIRADAKPLYDGRAIAAHNVVVMSWNADRSQTEAGLLLLKKVFNIGSENLEFKDILHSVKDIETDLAAADTIVRRFRTWLGDLRREFPLAEGAPSA